MNSMEKGFSRLGSLLSAIGILAAVLIIISVTGDQIKLPNLLDKLHWSSLFILIPLGIANHFLRFWRWELLLARVSTKKIKKSIAFLIYSAGSLLIFTPARVGEVAKSVYTRDFFDIPIATSLPVLFAERITDMFVMAFLAGLGLFLLNEPFNLLLGGIILIIGLSVFVFRKPLLNWGTRWSINRFGPNSRLAQVFSLVNDSQGSLFSRDGLIINGAIGTNAWMVEVTIFFYTLNAVGMPDSLQLFSIALAVFPLASLGGSLSFLPGGLGVTEGGIVALGILLGDLPKEGVVLSALLSRLIIMGVVILVGIISVFLLRRLRHNN
jgi:uncharacterized protein (TIRG00374 family)